MYKRQHTHSHTHTHTHTSILGPPLAPCRWARLLQYIIPLYDGVGSLLMVISKMIVEVFKFAVPGTILMMGVAFTMFATFR